MDRAKVTKDVLCEEARFILANVLAEGRYGRQNRVEDIMRICEGAVSIPFREYVTFLEGAGYLKHDRGNDTLDVTPTGERIVTGEGLNELKERASVHFRPSATPPPPRPERRPLASEPGTSVVHRGDTGLGEVPHYERLDVLGSGGIGTVIRARQVRLERVVALKEIHDPRRLGLTSWEEARERFDDVVKSSALLSHPHVLMLLDAGVNGERPFVVTELMFNGSVRRLLDRHQQLPPALVLKLTLELLHGLSAAHEAGVIHGGLKPENMLLDASGNLKISDFGMSRVVEHAPQDGPNVFVGSGSVAYLAPELYRDPEATSPQADLYAAGILFYEMLAGKLPGRRSPMPSKLCPELPASIDDVFDKLTQDDVGERYESAAAAIQEFTALEGMARNISGALDMLYRDEAGKLLREAAEAEAAPVPARGNGNGNGGGNGHGDGSESEEEKTGQVEVKSADKDKGDKPRRRPYSYQQRLRGGSKGEA